MAKEKPIVFGAKTSQSNIGHLVQFYRSENELIANLCKFVVSGIKLEEVCLIIATPKHQANLLRAVRLAGVNHQLARENGRLIIFEAEKLLQKFSNNGILDRAKFFEVIGSVVSKPANQGKTIRAFGEMVALLWKAGNKSAVIELEKLWNELAGIYDFKLYCAYPELHFVLDSATKAEINNLHIKRAANHASH